LPATRAAASIQTPPSHVAHRVDVDRLPRLPALVLAEVGAAEGGVAPRVRRTAEADLVPRPRVCVEGLDDVAHHDRPRAGDVDRAPDAAVQLALREAVHDLHLHI